ncbi:MAG: FAD binding domain-containing protein, partial [Gudongella sp.]|nr:FAD binding domain-containing protein [Gudongella sp.]
MVATYCPKTLEEAIQIRMEKSVIPFAGGTDLMVKYKSTRGALPAFPGDILYLGSLDELKAIEIRDDGIGIGAGVSLSSLILEKGLPDYIKAPVLGIGSPSIRNLGTIGGNICNASPAGDTIPFLYALDSILELKSLEGVRRMGIADFIKGPGKTELKADEILTGIFIPRPDFSRWGYRKVGARKANAISKLSVFYLADIRDSFLKD